MDKTPKLIIAIVALIVGLGVGYWYGGSVGYSRAEADIQKLEQQTAKEAADAAAKAANPFRASNPLENVGANPFEKTKDILNPFK